VDLLRASRAHRRIDDCLGKARGADLRAQVEIGFGCRRVEHRHVEGSVGIVAEGQPDRGGATRHERINPQRVLGRHQSHRRVLERDSGDIGGASALLVEFLERISGDEAPIEPAEDSLDVRPAADPHGTVHRPAREVADQGQIRCRSADDRANARGHLHDVHTGIAVLKHRAPLFDCTDPHGWAQEETLAECRKPGTPRQLGPTTNCDG
jgi:hypothetical protein